MLCVVHMYIYSCVRVSETVYVCVSERECVHIIIEGSIDIYYIIIVIDETLFYNKLTRKLRPVVPRPVSSKAILICIYI